MVSKKGDTVSTLILLSHYLLLLSRWQPFKLDSLFEGLSEIRLVTAVELQETEK